MVALVVLPFTWQQQCCCLMKVVFQRHLSPPLAFCLHVWCHRQDAGKFKLLTTLPLDTEAELHANKKVLFK
jgi:hypothetical protein